MRRVWLTLCLAGILGGTALVSGGGAEAAAAVRRPAHLVTITIASHGRVAPKWLSYQGRPRANVLLPAGYDPHRRYPVLFMLHGLDGSYHAFADNGIAATFAAAGFPGIVVMPEGAGGWYADWWNNGKRADPAWESYELDDVIPAILNRFPIKRGRRYHAIAGISMGGLGASYLGGRLPGFFGSVASLSGFVDPQLSRIQLAGLSLGWTQGDEVVSTGMGLTSLAALKGDAGADPVLGPPNGFYATGHNPTRLAANLEQTRVFVSTGTGVPSKTVLGKPQQVPVAAAGSALEAPIIYPMNVDYGRALTAAGVDVTYQEHPGGHDNPDFIDEVKAMLAWGVFKPVVTHPHSWANDTVATRGRLWDVHYRFAAPPDRVVQFRRSGHALTVSAAGSAVAVTAGRCRVRTATPATIRLPTRHGCVAASVDN